MASAEGLSERVAAHVARLDYDDLPASTVRAARHVLLDAVGVMLGASGLAEREVAPFVALATSGGDGPSAILGTGISVPPASAALANGAMAHALDYEDAFDLVPGHPNASLVPALIALAQSGRPVSGRDFLAALAAGGDLSCRMALALERPMEAGNWYPPPIVAGMGASAGAARLLGLDADGVRDALSLALCQVTMPGEIKFSAQTEIRAVREAFPAQAAVQSAILAASGVTGFEAPLEGQGGFYALYALGEYSADRLTDRLGEYFWLDQLTFKPWPSCRGTHPFIEAALMLREEGVLAEKIAAIDLVLDPVQEMLVVPHDRKAAPSVIIDAKFSVPFCTALALERGRVTLDDFTPDALRDERVLRLSSLCSHSVAPRADWQRGSGGALSVTLLDGTRREIEVKAAKGSPLNPLGEAELRAKFLDCAARAKNPLDSPSAEALADAILSLEDCADVGALLA